MDLASYLLTQYIKLTIYIIVIISKILLFHTFCIGSVIKHCNNDADYINNIKMRRMTPTSERFALW